MECSYLKIIHIRESRHRYVAFPPAAPPTQVSRAGSFLGFSAVVLNLVRFPLDRDKVDNFLQLFFFTNLEEQDPSFERRLVALEVVDGFAVSYDQEALRGPGRKA